jgi:integrase
VEKRGVRRTKVFQGKAEAKAWAVRQEYEIENQEMVSGGNTLGEAFDKYGREVSVKKRGERWEVIRLERFKTYPISNVKMKDVRASDFAKWRDARLLEVKGASVRREMQLMSAVVNVARKEWGWINANPLSDVRKPPASPRRNRLVSENEMAALSISAGSDPKDKTARSFLAFQFAIETGMRAGEIVGLVQDRIDRRRRVAHLPITKNGEARDVPLSRAAMGILERLEGDPVFGLTSQNLDVLWRKVRDRAGIEGLTFHDARHVAITRLAKKLDVLDLARMVGHRDIKMLLVYYEADAEDLARKLD